MRQDPSRASSFAKSASSQRRSHHLISWVVIPAFILPESFMLKKFKVPLDKRNFVVVRYFRQLRRLQLSGVHSTGQKISRSSFLWLMWERTVSKNTWWVTPNLTLPSRVLTERFPDSFSFLPTVRISGILSSCASRTFLFRLSVRLSTSVRTPAISNFFLHRLHRAQNHR